MTKTVLILGAGFVGITIAHKLLKETLPKVSDLKVILVTPNTHFYWNPAAVRGIIPGEVDDENMFMPIEPAFSKYPSRSFEFVLGKATGINTEGNEVVVSLGRAGDEKRIGYDHLVIATGSAMKAKDMPFKLMGTTEETQNRLHSLQKEVEGAGSILIAGGGPTGVETAAELGEKYSSSGKKITLVVASPRPLDVLSEKSSSIALSTLQKLGVDVITGASVVGHKGRQAELSTGRTIDADLYLPLFGVTPNTEFLPSAMLTPRGDVLQEPTLQAKGFDNVWAAGDAGSVEWKTAAKADPQAAHVTQNLSAVLTGQGKAGVKEYVGGKMVMAATLGKNTGTGEMGGWRLWGWLVKMVKAKTLMVEKMGPKVTSGV
ncbi:nucleotide-binding domain-containing protein [Zalerion maritima]|uniref:Nucleotide-binding domain-containing protein n=1 Tax=Zalerion maritima TaxID=339359 RepID=A0AAD5RUE2_9PEZI|nr:nucleotide-binding domain-containing protein [Zalerion maritima]